MNDKDFSRQSFLGSKSEEILAGTRVLIAGLGGGGSHIAQQLAHIGVGEIRLVDPDRIEPSNLNRLVGALHSDLEQSTPKIDIAVRTIHGVRPWIKTSAVMDKWQAADSLLKDAHIIFGCLDGYQQRHYLENAARRFCLPYIDIGMDVCKIGDNAYAVAGQMIVSKPFGPCMKCLGFINDQRLSIEENRYGDAGIAPQVIWTNGTLASLAIGAMMKLLTPWSSFDETYTWLELDGNAQTVTRSKQPMYMPQHKICPHYAGPDILGDPFFRLNSPI